jgi:hypothetical protein
MMVSATCAMMMPTETLMNSLLTAMIAMRQSIREQQNYAAMGKTTIAT